MHALVQTDIFSDPFFSDTRVITGLIMIHVVFAMLYMHISGLRFWLPEEEMNW